MMLALTVEVREPPGGAPLHTDSLTSVNPGADPPGYHGRYGIGPPGGSYFLPLPGCFLADDPPPEWDESRPAFNAWNSAEPG